MESLRLAVPDKTHEAAAREYIKEFIENNSEIYGSGGLDR
jgi:ABC-type phosphate transport system auxiliary subunit